jgi:hypothetical protein
MSARVQRGSDASASHAPSARVGASRQWLDRWLATCGDLAELQASHPMMDAVIDEVDGRRGELRTRASDPALEQAA